MSQCLFIEGCSVDKPGEWRGGCLHLQCQIGAGYLPTVTMYNRRFRAEVSNGWLRFLKRDGKRDRLAAVYWAGKRDWINKGRPIGDGGGFSMAFVFGGLDV